MSTPYKNKTPAQLLGTVRKLTRAGQHIVDRRELLAPFSDDAAVIRSFCTGCGQYLGLTRTGAEQLAKRENITLPDLLAGVYFQVESCVACGDAFKKVTLRSIE